MKTVFDAVGQPAGSIDGDELYWSDGRQICFLDNGYIFTLADGDWVRSYAAGVFFNIYSKPVGFVKGCKPSLALAPPKLKSMLPSRLASVGPDVRDAQFHTIPDFLKDRLEPQKAWMMP